MPENNDPEKFFVRVTRTYQGRTSTKFLLRAIPMGKEDHAVKGVPVGKALAASLIFRFFYYIIPAFGSIFIYWGLRMSEPRYDFSKQSLNSHKEVPPHA